MQVGNLLKTDFCKLMRSFNYYERFRVSNVGQVIYKGNKQLKKGEKEIQVQKYNCKLV